MVMEHNFNALSLEACGHLRGYRDWLGLDRHGLGLKVPAKILQLHKADAPSSGNLKKPSHILYLDHALKVFPDARLIGTHRGP